MSGMAEDKSGAPLYGMEFELLSGKKVFRNVPTDNKGKYDFGEVPAGTYKLRVKHGYFCSPQVHCGDQQCTIEQRLKINPKNTVTVY